MKIGFFTDSYHPQVNGVTYTLEAWRKGLEGLGHEVHIFYPAADYAPKIGEHPFFSFDFRFYPGYRVAVPYRLPSVTKDLDIMHQHGLYGMAIAGLHTAKKYDLPKVLTFHTPGDNYIAYLPFFKYFSGAYSSAYKVWERWLLNRHQHITTGSEEIRKKLLKNKIEEVEVLSNGVDLSLFNRVDATGFKEKLGLGDEKVIGFCGRLGYEKHVEDLINAADDFDGQVLIAGDGPARDYYANLAKGKDNVRVLDFIKRDELRSFYSALDVFVFSSFCETQGLVALESMACETPVVAVPVAALKDTVEEGKTGYHYSPGDVKGLLEKVQMCFENTGRLRRECLKEAEKNSVDKSVQRLTQIYNGLLSDSSM